MSQTRLSHDALPAERRPSLVHAAYEAIKRAICNGEFAPGFQGSEIEIAERLGMSRTPVHQAIIRLQAEGMVELKAKRGVVICALSPADMRAIYDVIVAVEGMAAMLAAERRTVERQALCADLEALNGGLRQAIDGDDLHRWAALDSDFHARLVEGSANGRLEQIAKVHLDQSHRARRMTLRLRPRPVRSLAEHQAIVDAIRIGDGTAARDAAQAHKIAARDLIINLLETYHLQHL
ncbi:GntR family transcriptional regulator [Jiella sp. MQZ9-1]|uniref:GntR family transcriptional regulator n=1 Tax=Jiella flava TaxID=2816857 RepID=A0A939JUR7_9HYPH|nr:GntR family transcriptional regulator [Jiella flava]MBO0661699.1 GntR family transcriptional regulator [Jiella flava]MCD2470341.1 GntR family transcriptional regulator [Jiella flava]